ncbi:MAG: hypothetical protein K0S42_2373, partial [Microvirga sp.]|nr:hypothetical protein [Microvirga sp.]
MGSAAVRGHLDWGRLNVAER